MLNEIVRKCGNQKKLADNLGISQPTISMWRRRRSKIPAQYCVKIEKLTGIKKEEIRPDVFFN